MSLLTRARDGIVAKVPLPVLPSFAPLLNIQSEEQVFQLPNTERKPSD